MNILIYFILSIIMFIVLSLTDNNILVSITTSAIVTLIFSITQYFLEDNKYPRDFYLSYITKTFFRRKDIRFSISYLFKIKIGQEYLLVKGNRIKGQFQPVGGVYKFYSGIHNRFKEWQVKDDDNIAIDELSKNDLRVRVKGKYVMKFLEWFRSNSYRETSAEREFIEELIETKLIPLDEFHKIQYQFSKRIQTPLKKEKRFNCYQILIADIYEIILTIKQEEILQNLKLEKNESYIWAREDDIKKLGYEKGNSDSIVISPTAEWILDK